MNTKQLLVIFIVIFSLIVFSSALYGAPANNSAGTATATMLANTCAGCHGTKGSSVGPASPTIAGISYDYFIETMKGYQSGERPSTIMSRIAKGYSEKEIELMADYFSKQSFVRLPQNYDANAARRGKKLHKKYCGKCHEEDGRSAEDDAGILAGQWEPYLRFTLEDFTSGNRPMAKKKKERMNKLDKAHGEAGIDDLVHFYAGQQ